MQLKTAIQAVIGAAALAIAGTAMAQTALNDTTGDVFLNIVNTTNNTSFIYDTGLTQAQFGAGTAAYSQSLSTNSTFEQFLSAAGGSLTGSGIDYSVFSVTNSSSAGLKVDFTTNSATNSGATALTVAQAETEIEQFLVGANANNTATTPLAGSAILNSSFYFAQPTVEGAIEAALLSSGGSDNSAVGTALGFYTTTATSGRVGTYGGTTKDPGTWLLSSTGTLSYSGSGSPVPLPTPLLLLLSGLGLMGVVARRGKSDRGLVNPILTEI